MAEVALLNRPRPRRAMSVLRTQVLVIYALMMHDIKARFFGNGLGYLVTILWPGAHIAIIVAIYFFSGRIPPYGNNSFLYACIGVLPYIIWNYISRFTMLGVLMNRNFLSYPIIRPLDMMVARQLLEIVSSTIITFVLIGVLFASGAPVVPDHPADAALALLSAAYLGIGFGILGGVICMIWPLFNILYVGLLILTWISAGVAIDPEALPAKIGYFLSFNPLLHSIEWLRSAYYPDFPAHLLDKSYVIAVASVSLFLGLVLERVCKAYILR